jgi:hypothetical protein
MMTALIVVAPTSWAAPIDITGTGVLGSFTGTLDYHSATASTAVLDVTLTNTSASGFLTAIALNNPGDSLTGISLATPPTPTTFNALGLASNGVNGQPLGWFDFGAGTGGNWEGGGPPSNGLAANASATFRFNLVGTNLTALDTTSFATTFSAVNHNNPAPTDDFLAVRFRGFANGGSDKVSASVVPLPAAVWLFGSGLIGLAGLARRKFSA